MARFQEVIEQFKRLCDSANQDCLSCRLRNMSCSMKDVADNSVEFEKRVMSWAAEHPEPVYPTWGEWFVSRGMLPEKWDNLTSAYMNVGCVPNLIHSPIPADIAQKLGIEPKEG